MSDASAKTVVVTGAAGSFGRVVVPHLVDEGYTVHAVDRAHWAGYPPGVTYHHVDVLKRGFDDVLRRVQPEAVIHLAMIHRFQGSRRERHRVNFTGTAKVIESAVQRGVKKLIFGSRATVYGALADQAQFLTEEHPPAAGRMFSDMQDLVSADLYASGMLWRYPEVELVVLRFVNVLGPNVSTLLQRYLSRRRVFTVAGFDPIYQVMHEKDMAQAIRLSLATGVRGIYNVVGPGQVPLHVLVDESGGTRVPLPEPVLRLLKGRLGFPNLPDGAVEFLKHSCTVDGRRFQQATGFAPRFDLRATLGAVAQSKL